MYFWTHKISGCLQYFLPFSVEYGMVCIVSSSPKHGYKYDSGYEYEICLLVYVGSKAFQNRINNNFVNTRYVK